MANDPPASGGEARRLGRALQALRRADAEVLEIRGPWDSQETAKAMVADFVQAFELEVVFSELPDGFRVELREPPSRTIRLDF